MDGLRAPHSPAPYHGEAGDRSMLSSHFFRNLWWMPQHLSRWRRCFVHDRKSGEELEAYYLDDRSDRPRKLALDQQQLRSFRERTMKAAEGGFADQFLALSPGRKDAVNRAVQEANRCSFRPKTCAGIHVQKVQAQSEPSLVVFFVLGDPVEPVRLRFGLGVFYLPFDLCRRWEGMRVLLEDAFRGNAVLVQSVQLGHYELVTLENDIILPAVWDKAVRPGWDLMFLLRDTPSVQPVLYHHYHHHHRCHHNHHNVTTYVHGHGGHGDQRTEYSDLSTGYSPSLAASALPSFQPSVSYYDGHHAGSPPPPPPPMPAPDYPLPESSLGEREGEGESHHSGSNQHSEESLATETGRVSLDEDS
ncbi:hypothetical protein F4809DRAFT_661040 [Biscogniauxia mediterranea]|nr:hypothetical protein F4809DRAFT_661040 [Biscogniauxia mediterranea]